MHIGFGRIYDHYSVQHGPEGPKCGCCNKFFGMKKKLRKSKSLERRLVRHRLKNDLRKLKSQLPLALCFCGGNGYTRKKLKNMADVKLLGTGLKLAVLELNGGTGLSRELSRIAHQSNSVTSWVVDRLGGIKCEMTGSLLRLRLQQVKQLNPDPAPGELLTGIEFQFSMLERMIENDMSYDPTSGPERVADEGGALQQEQVKQHRSGWACFSCGQQASPAWILEQMRKKPE